MEFPIQHIPWKRIFDLGFSFAILLLGLPIFALIALSIVCTSKGSIFFFQERIGRGGKRFTCYKFRTMYSNAEERLKELLKSDACLRKEWEEKRKLEKDPRVTPLGRFLRKSSLDELPQFWNVLKGDLSVVGPRPVGEEEVKNYMGSKAEVILSIRPGLTGIWQVSGRSTTTYEKRIALDIKYVRNYSLGLDLSLIARTIPVMVFSRGAC